MYAVGGFGCGSRFQASRFHLRIGFSCLLFSFRRYLVVLDERRCLCPLVPRAPYLTLLILST